MAVNPNDNIKHILIHRIDAVGDVVLTLPTCIYLKQVIPEVIISFLGRGYTKPIVDACSAVDHFIDHDELVLMTEQEQIANIRARNIDVIVHAFIKTTVARLGKKAGIPIRIGITSKNSHFLYCNRLIRLSRGKSFLHEAQRPIFLLRAIGIDHVPTQGTLAYSYRDHFKPATELPERLSQHLKADKFNLILHPKSNGSGREWHMDRFKALINKIPASKFNIIITGSPKEALLFEDWVKDMPANVTDLSGKMSLAELVAFIFKADGLLASGTGPVHIGAASGIHTLGLFPISWAMNAIQWAPLGRKGQHIESDSDDLSSISVDMVMDAIMEWVKPVKSIS
ncbi:MAG: glycosyltransferase family 9 protein [Mucilaginibacter sp.]|uniref:glycosyltransferase family 9 protein n=1 Tax=Mucilaginibacter sp. TaxID=1882438 RepID=UPI003267DC10